HRRNKLRRCRRAAPGRRARAARGWLWGGVLGQAYPPVSLLTRAKNLFELKTRGELAIFAVFPAAGNALQSQITTSLFIVPMTPSVAEKSVHVVKKEKLKTRNADRTKFLPMSLESYQQAGMARETWRRVVSRVLLKNSEAAGLK